MLRGRGDLLLYRQVRQEPLPILRADFGGAAHPVEMDETPHLAHIGLFGSSAQVLQPDLLTNLVRQFGLRHQNPCTAAKPRIY
jgi:hypothetical protein